MSTINREDALDAVYERIKQIGYEHNASVLSIRQAIRDLPSVQPDRWILWDSGRLPDDSGTYIVTAYDGAKERVTFAKYQKRLKRWELTGRMAYWRVLAWMPLPEPWKEGSKE